MLTQGRVLTVVFHAFIKDYIGIFCLRVLFHLYFQSLRGI